MSETDLINMHLPRIRALVRGGVDLIAIETIPSLREAKVILDILKSSFPETKAWVSFALRLNEVSLLLSFNPALTIQVNMGFYGSLC